MPLALACSNNLVMRLMPFITAGCLAAAATAACLAASARNSAEPARVTAAPIASWRTDRSAATPDARWRQIGVAARAAVLAETPNAALPFRPATTGSAARIVVAHYIPVFPLSIDGKPPAGDYYATNYLDPEGEDGRHRARGGYLRERPLPSPVVLPPPYRDANAALEVARAARIGIDAFGVDLLALDGQVWRDAVLLLDAAAVTAPEFRIIPEPDMGSLRAAVSINQLADALAVFYRHPAGYRLRDGRLLVMPFMAERRTAAWWTQLSDIMAARGMPVVIVPVFLDSKTMPSFAALSPAASVWGDRYASGDRANRLSAAQAARAGIAAWFMPVAPQDYRPKDTLLMEARNSEAFRRQWTSAIDTAAAGVHLLTWNDYSESTELQPSSFSQFVWYDLNAFFIAWYKVGRPPKITRDALYFVHRPQLVSGSHTPTVRGAEPVANDIEVVALLTAPGEIMVETVATRIVQRAAAGLATMRVPAEPGHFRVTLRRGGRTVLTTRSNVAIDPAPTRSDATYGGGSSTRPFVPVR